MKKEKRNQPSEESDRKTGRKRERGASSCSSLAVKQIDSRRRQTHDGVSSIQANEQMTPSRSRLLKLELTQLLILINRLLLPYLEPLRLLWLQLVRGGLVGHGCGVPCCAVLCCTRLFCAVTESEEEKNQCNEHDENERMRRTVASKVWRKGRVVVDVNVNGCRWVERRCVDLWWGLDFMRGAWYHFTRAQRYDMDIYYKLSVSLMSLAGLAYLVLGHARMYDSIL